MSLLASSTFKKLLRLSFANKQTNLIIDTILLIKDFIGSKKNLIGRN